MSRESLNRREFLQRAGAGSAAFLGAAGITIHESPEQLSRIGVQLYTVRNQMRESVEKTLEQVARIGYKEVEFAGYFNRPPRAIRQLPDFSSIYAISISGFGRNNDHDRAMNAGFDVFLAKPVDIELLEKLLNEH